MYCQSNNWGRFRKFLWPSQNVWTLLIPILIYGIFFLLLFTQQLRNLWCFILWLFSLKPVTCKRAWLQGTSQIIYVCKISRWLIIIITWLLLSWSMIGSIWSRDRHDRGNAAVPSGEPSEPGGKRNGWTNRPQILPGVDENLLLQRPQITSCPSDFQTFLRPCNVY